MSASSVAHLFTALCAQGQFEEAQRYWSDDVVSTEAFPGPHQVSRGRAAVRAKQQAWSTAITIHGTKAEGPFVSADQFAVRFEMDCTGPDGVRQTLREVALYTVADGKITEESFLPLMAG